MATHHDAFLAAGARVYGISVDTPEQQAAMVTKLALPFGLLSDPDRSAAIAPLGVADTRDPREIARPAMIVLAPGGEEVWRVVSRDFADRLPEEEVLTWMRTQGWPATSQPPPTVGPAVPGAKAMSLDALPTYFRGARFAALAMGLRHRHRDEAIAEDSKAYVAEVDRFIEAVTDLQRRTRG